MRRLSLGLVGLVAFVILSVVICISAPARTAQPELLAGAIKGPEDYHRDPVNIPLQAQTLPVTYTSGVAIVGDVDSATQSFIDDMEDAVAALENHGVDMTTFYYGQDTFDWSDIVSATNGANFLLYAGHGIWWGGTDTSPSLVGGFYLGGSEFIHPDTVRQDLTGRMADQAVVLLSHVCYSAGSTASDPTGTPDVTEASRRVQMYADPFIDAGFEAYYANNYYGSMANYVNYILYEGIRPTYGETYATYWPFDMDEQYSYAFDSENSKWLNGEPGNWDLAFVGNPNDQFTGDISHTAELAELPDGLLAFYDQGTGQWVPDTFALYLQNIGSTATLTVTIETNSPYVPSPATYRAFPSPTTVELPLVNILPNDDSDVMTITMESPDNPEPTQYTIPLMFVLVPEVQMSYLPLCAR